MVVICRAGEPRQDLNPFYFSLLGSICAAASARGYETLVSFQDGAGGFNGRYQEQRKADGLIVIGTTENRAGWDHFRDAGTAGLHWVCWGSPFDELEWIRSDNDAGARLATRHLIERGYEQIACIGALDSPQRQFAERYEGYAAAMRDAGLEPRLIALEPGPAARGARTTRGRRFAGGSAGLPTHCSWSATRLPSECSKRSTPPAWRFRARSGWSASMAFAAGAHSAPPLSSIEPDFAAAGALLVDRLLGGDTVTERRVPVRLIARESTRR